MPRLIDADAVMKELGITSDDCCECEWGDGNGYCSRTSDFTEACDAICTALPIEPEPQWIPCSERLPEDVKTGEEYPTLIYCTGGGEVDAGWYEAKAHIWWNLSYDDMVDNVIAWKPLPEAYKPDDFSQHMNPPED